LTGHANYFIDRGFYDIYDETFEKLNFKIKTASNESKSETFDMFAEDDNNIAASTSEKCLKENLIEGELLFLSNFPQKIRIFFS
jgi:hypothetical protein